MPSICVSAIAEALIAAKSTPVGMGVGVGVGVGEGVGVGAGGGGIGADVNTVALIETGDDTGRFGVRSIVTLVVDIGASGDT